MIEAKGLTRRFGDTVAVDRLSLQVPAGAIMALLGPNGAGKTTTVRMLAGLLASSAGEAVVAGCDVRADPAGVRARVGLVTDVPGLYEPMPLGAYLNFFGRLYRLDAATRARRVDELLAFFDLTDRRNVAMVGFSKGMKQKVALCRALLHEPAVLFLDEPTSGLDPLAARAVRELVLRLKQSGRAIVLCTHDLHEAERLADEIVVLRQGRVVASGTPAALRAAAAPRPLVRLELAPGCPPDVPALAARAGADAPTLGSVGEDTFLLEFGTPDPRRVIPRVIAQLAAAGSEILSARVVLTPLEDVYATLLAGGDGACAPLAAPPLCGRAIAARHEPVAAGRSAPDPALLFLIARRAAAALLPDHSILYFNLALAVVIPLWLRPGAGGALLGHLAAGPQPATLTGTIVATFALLGLLPSFVTNGLAAGSFAGERETGSLTPLLSSPASNLAIFGGKALGAALPALAFGTLADAVYVVGLAASGLGGALRLVPLALWPSLLALVPLGAVGAAAVVSLISARVRTAAGAHQVGSLVTPWFMGIFTVLAARLQAGPFAVTVALLAAADVALIIWGAATWRREEVLARR
ncbi:MAG: ATP-binding cassette domain-containing protein [Chloroflexota bacterium]